MYRTDLQDALDHLEEMDREFYRVEKDYISGTVAMDSSAQGYRGISTYNSVMNGYVKDFVETCCPELFYADYNHYTFWNHVEDNRLAAFLGIRYILSGDGNPDESEWKLLDKVGSLYIHENALEADTAHFYTSAISEDSLRELCARRQETGSWKAPLPWKTGKTWIPWRNSTRLSPAERRRMENIQNGESANRRGSCRNGKKDRIVAEESYVTLDAPEKDSRITGSIHAETEGYALFMIPYEDGWKLTIDGEEAELLRGDIGFLACEVPEGDHTLELTFHAPGLMEGAAGSAACWAAFAILCAVPGIKKKRKSMRRI